MKILIFAEQRGGDFHPAVSQLITAAREADPSCELAVCVAGKEVNDLAGSLGSYGITRVIVVDAPALELYRPQPYARALRNAIDEYQPSIVMLAASFMGRDLAPRIAAHTGAAIATDCIELKLDGNALEVKRPVYMGKATAEMRLDPERLKVVSIRTNTFAAAEKNADAKPEIQQLTLNLDESESILVNQECVSTGSGTKDVTEADIVVSGGRSLKNEENFKILFELADVLDAAVGASRAACDAGYQPHSRQIGLTGKTVTPKLYLAFGIDGAIQHLAGMRGSKVIAAINTKKDAPIFGVADYGCVADLFVMAPLLTEEFKKVLKS